MQVTKEVKQIIRKDTYDMLRAKDSVDIMRRTVRKMFVPHILWKEWYGCRLLVEDGEYVIYHRIDCNAELSVKGE